MTNASPILIDFDIRIFKAGDNYTVTAQTPDSGLAESQLDADALFAAEFQEKLTQIREEPFTTDESLFREVGESLFRALFQGQVRDLFLATWSQEVQAANRSLRLRLNIDEAAIDLAALPWEMMLWRDVFLSTQIDTLVTRQLLNLEYGSIKSLKVAGPPRVLIVIPGGSGLNTDAEEKAITAALDKAGVAYETLKDKVPLQLLDDALAEGEYAILHFIGHAAFEQDETGEVHGSLRFNSSEQDIPAEEDEDWAPETDLQALLGNHKSLKLVVLNACNTGELAKRPGDRGFWGVIPSLLRAGAPAVVAMQYAIRDDVAALFGETFYRRLTAGKGAGHVDVAVTLARNACFLAWPDDRGFATPALYLRSRDGVIFELSGEQADIGEKAESLSCPKAPKPSDFLLYRYRNADLETLIARVPLLTRRLQRLTFQIDDLKTKGALDEKSAWRLQRYERNRDDLEREMDELQDVLIWRRYEVCEELRGLQAQAALKQQEKAVLEEAGGYVSYDLKNAIFTMTERILELQDLLRKSQEVIRDD